MTTSPRARSRFLGLAPAAFLLAGLCAVSAGPSAVPVAAGPPTGAVIAWGDNTYGQTDVPAGLSGVTAISAGGGHNLTPADGTVVGWGDDTWGQIDVPAGLSDIVAISAGGGFSLALKSDGTVVAWGRDDYGAIDVPAGHRATGRWKSCRRQAGSIRRVATARQAAAARPESRGD